MCGVDKLTPLVSVVIPFYSNKEWLQEALESVISQTYSNLEIIVVNDGSSELLTELESKYANVVSFINQSNGGPSKARNTGIINSNGKYIAFLDSDDIWMNNKIEKQISQMENNHSVWSQHSYYMFWDEDERVKLVDTEGFQGDVFVDCFISFKIQTSTVVVRRDILVKNNIFFPLGKRYGQDLTFYKQLAQMYPLDYLDGVYSKFRMRGSNAGFRANVQLHNKAEVWNEIRKDEQIISILPRTIIFAYKLSKFNSNIVNLFEKHLKSRHVIEFLSKVLYLLPYTIFKQQSRKRLRD